jgi:O-antigen/teichoic acid export membrane protein
MGRDTAAVIAIAAAGQVVAYGLAIFLARWLGVAGFEAYVVASAIFIVMVALAPCGLDKFAVRAIPPLLVHHAWGKARGFLRYGVRRTLLASLAIAVAGFAAAAWRTPLDTADGMHAAILVAVIAVPAGALAHFGLEALSATGREVLATAILRLGVPLLVLGLIGVAIAASLPLRGATAVGAWALAWVGAVALLAVALGRALPAEVWRATPEEAAATWRAGATLFWVHRAAMAFIAQASVIGLEVLQPSASAVGAYAAALASTAPAVVLVTATNRLYARRLSVLIETGDAAAIAALHRERLRWLVPAVVAFLAVTLVFAERIVGLFGAAFVAEGALPLRILALTAAFTMLSALAPAWMKFTGQRSATLPTLVVAVGAQLLLLAILVPRFGATGAALSYALSMIGLYAAFALLARRGLARLRPGHRL